MSSRSDDHDTADEATATGLLREDTSDPEVNAWTNAAAARVLARLRLAHGEPVADGSGIFNTGSPAPLSPRARRG